MAVQLDDLSTFLDDVYSRLDPSQVFDGVFHHNWQKSGNKWRGRCPWHDSKSGTAFYLDAKSLTWRCPSCDRGGGPIQYLHQVTGGNGSPRGAQFVEYAKVLGDMTGVELPSRERTPEQQERFAKIENRQSMLATVISFCHRLLVTESEKAIAYLTEERGFTREDIDLLQLGVFPSGRRIADLLGSKGFDLADAVDCGLLFPRTDKNGARVPDSYGSQLEGYITVPWNDEHGRPLTIYGRWHSQVAPEGKPKTTALRNPGAKDEPWLKSKRSPLYLDRALAAGCKDLVVVEGVFDAAILQARGDARVVAWVAANPSEEQVETLKRSRVKSATLCLDPDSAGIKGTRQSLKHLVKAGIMPYAAPVLPEGQDPDEFVIANGLDAWKSHISQSTHGFRYEAQQILAPLQPLTDANLQQALEEAKAFAATIPDSLKPETDVFFWSEFNQGTGTEVTTGSRPSDELRKAVLEFDAIQNPFDKVLAENEIASEYKVRGAKLDKLIDFAKGVETESSPLADLMMSQFSTLEERANGGIVPGLMTGFRDLDAMTQGFQPSNLIICAARPSMGKTSLVVNFLRNIAALGGPCIFFSLEMDKAAVSNRMLAAESRVVSERLRTGRIQSAEWENIGHAISKLSSLPLMIDDNPNPSVADIRRKSLEVKEKYGSMGAIAIDYLQLMDSQSGANRNDELSRITRGLKGLAKELQCPIIVLSQLSRGVESRQDKRPMMSDLRDSGAIEADADLVMMLYRDEYYNKDTPDRGMAELIIAKQREGPVGTIKLLFEPQFTQFRNMAVQPNHYD
jgi:replicative DNA helicase